MPWKRILSTHQICKLVDGHRERPESDRFQEVVNSDNFQIAHEDIHTIRLVILVVTFVYKFQPVCANCNARRNYTVQKPVSIAPRYVHVIKLLRFLNPPKSSTTDDMLGCTFDWTATAAVCTNRSIRSFQHHTNRCSSYFSYMLTFDRL